MRVDTHEALEGNTPELPPLLLIAREVWHILRAPPQSIKGDDQHLLTEKKENKTRSIGRREFLGGHLVKNSRREQL